MKRACRIAFFLLAGAALLGAALCGGSEWYAPTELLSPDLEAILALRLRRLVTAFLVGAALATGGTACQAVLRNDLADPYLLGISGGASLGAALAILTGAAMQSAFALPGGAFLGALAALAVVLFPARHGDTGNRVLLSGVIIGAISGSLLMLLISVMGHSQLNSIVWWLLGNLDGRDTSLLAAAGSLIFAGAVVLTMLSRETNALSVGADFAHGFGVAPARAALTLLGVAALLAAAAVSLAGVIGFVGLVVPHIARRLVGPEHRKLYPSAFFCGGVFLALCDLGARSVYQTQELPVGVVTSLIGGPFFLWLLYRKQCAGGGR